MNRRTASLVVLVVAAMTVVAVPAAGLGPGDIAGDQGLADDVGEDEANETNARAAANGTDNGTPPGSKLAGVIGVQEAEIEGEVRSRSFEVALNRSDDNGSKAAVIAGQVIDLESRLDSLQERKNELDQLRENGTITEGEYRAQVAEIGARISTVQRIANQTENASQGVPAEKLQAKGVNTTKIQELRNNARNLSGQEVAAITRGVAGPGAGKGLGRGPPANKTNPGQGNGANPGQGDGANPGQGDGANPGQGDGTNPGQGDGANPGQGDGTDPGQGDGANPGQGDGTNPGQGDGTNPGKDDGTNPGQGNGTDPGQDNGTDPGQDNGAPGNETGPSNDTGPGDGQSENGEPGPPESNTSNNETDTPDMDKSGNGTDVPEDGRPADNETAPGNGGSEGGDDETPVSVTDTTYASVLDEIVVSARG